VKLIMRFQRNLAVLGAAALLFVCTSAEVLFSAQGPIVAESGLLVGTTQIVDEMHLEVDVELHGVQEATWSNVLFVGTMPDNSLRMPAIFIHSDADVYGASNDGWYMQFGGPKDISVGGEPLVAGKHYHFDMDWTQSRVIVKINGRTVKNSGNSIHANYDSLDVYVGSSIHMPSNVTVSNFVISTDLSCYVEGYECGSDEDCGDDGKCVPRTCDLTDIDDLKKEIVDLKKLVEDIHSHFAHN